VWVGTSVENQATADERIPALLKIPAAKRFISVEPMLGPVDFSAFFGGEYVGLPGDKIIPNYNFGIDWVICGGESGPNARPMHPDWVRDLRDQCVEAGLPFFFKQWGEWIHGNREAEENCMISPNGADVTELPGLWDEHTITISRVGKKRAGRVLDGRTWDQVPE
jgi:protein gp37